MGPYLEDEEKKEEEAKKKDVSKSGSEPKVKDTNSSRLSHTSSQSDFQESEKGKDKKDKNRPPTKIVIRRLPPSMNEETFLAQVEPLPEFDYMYFVRADMSLGSNAYSRAYINITNEDDIFTFKEKFDNYIFVDKKGSEYPAVVEFAPYQRLPKKIPRKDIKAGTIEEDPTYLAFLKELEEENKEKANTHACDYSYQPADYGPKAETTTPLLEFLKNRRAEKQRIRDERREDRRRKEIEKKKMREEEKRKKRPEMGRDGDAKQVLRSSHNESTDNSKSTQDGDTKLMREKKREDERLKYKTDKKLTDNRSRDKHDHQMSKPSPKSLDNRSSRKVMEDQRRGDDERRGDDQQRKRSQSGKITDSRRGQDGFNESRKHQSSMIDQRKHYERNHGRDKERYTNDNENRRSYLKDSIAKRVPKEKKIENSKPKEKAESKTQGSVDTKITTAEWDRNQVGEPSDHSSESKAAGHGLVRRFSLEGTVQHEMDFNDDEIRKSLRKSADDLEKLMKDSPVARLSSEEYKKDSNTKLYSTRYVKNTIRQTITPIRDLPTNMSTFLEFIENYKAHNSKQQQDSAIAHSQRRNSLESSEIDKQNSITSSTRETSGSGVMRRNLSLELETGSWGDHGTLSRETSIESSSEDRKDCSARGAKRSEAKTKKDPREERRIRNKDRPSIEIYRPGMGRFSRQRIEREKEQESSQSPSPTLSNRGSNVQSRQDK